ncbi:MAG: glycosyltransferase family 4 protein [Patescibacteria group bacterium]|nr:glycosyltransferase family 4 protein [Patescibacteria group bacterium]
MRIGIDARLWNETGVGRYIRSLFRYLPEVDKENEYLWLFRKKDFDKIVMPNEKWQKRVADIRWHTFSEQIILPKILLAENLDLVHFPYFSVPIFYPGKFVVTIHDLIFDHYKTGKSSTLPQWFYSLKTIGYKFVLNSSVKKASAIITVSNDSKREIIEHYNADPKKIFVTFESGNLEDDKKTDNNTEDFIKKLKPYILYVGNAHPHKNVESIILAMKKNNKTMKNLKLVLVGSDNFFYRKLKQFIKNESLEKKVVTVGTLANSALSAYYKNAECFVTASNMEGFGIPALEAMSMGCPAAVSNIPVFHEIYKDGVIYFNQNDPGDISSKIADLISDKNKKAELIKKGYAWAKTYDWKKTAKETVSVYNRVQ